MTGRTNKNGVKMKEGIISFHLILFRFHFSIFQRSKIYRKDNENGVKITGRTTGYGVKMTGGQTETVYK